MGKYRDKPLDRFVHSITYGNIWPYVLILASKEDVYAYQLPDLIEGRFGFRPNKIMMYVVLYKLEADGYITGKYRERRKYYTITEKGVNILNALRDVVKKLADQISK